MGVRWKDLRRSSNVRDVRGAGGGGRVPLRIGRGGGIGGGLGLLVILGLLFVLGGPEAVLQVFSGGGGAPTSEQGRPLAANDEVSDFVARVLGSTEDVWSSLFAQSGQQYRAPELALFAGAVQSACGFASAASGPFYCPGDQRVYLDTAFFDDLARMGGPGDFAAAYVIGHEIGHHVQTLWGISEKVQALKQQAMRSGDQPRANAYQVRMELQADCLAGVWASLNDQVKSRLQPGDVEAGLNAAAQIGDDTLQRRTQGQVVPESFTHGSAQQRVRWFKKGLESGRMQSCDTFDGKEL